MNSQKNKKERQVKFLHKVFPYLLGKLYICLQKWYQFKLIAISSLLICAYSITCFWIVSNSFQIEIIVHKMLKKFVQS